jgi:cytochrome o ubiquinol oxidase subunit 3
MFFGALISTHLIYRLHRRRAADPRWSSSELTSFSTFILLMSSLMMALAVTASKGNVKSCRWSLLACRLRNDLLGCGLRVQPFRA